MSTLTNPRCVRRRPGSAGFTLIELMVTLALLAVLMTLAAPSLLEWRRQAQLTTVTNQLVNALGTARSEALKRNVDVRLAFVKEGTAVIGWRVYRDANYNGQYDSGTDELILDHSTESSGKLPASITVALDASKGGKVVFNGSGYSQGSNQTMNLAMDGGLARRVIISSTGRVRSCRVGGGADGC